VLKRGAGRRRGPGQARAWPKGEALALVSHTMKEERAAELAAEYGFDLRTPMDSSIKLCPHRRGLGRHLSAPWADHGMGHGRGPRDPGRRRRPFTTPDGGPFVYGKADQGFRNGWFVARGK
jgi:3'(2'), 5'-bisphosphate nucleotidase